MIKTTEEPRCRQSARAHHWWELGKEDNGEKVERCNHCHALRYTTPAGRIRYEVPED